MANAIKYQNFVSSLWTTKWDTQCHSWLRHCATSNEVAVSTTDGTIAVLWPWVRISL